jgi:hypothetical protein
VDNRDGSDTPVRVFEVNKERVEQAAVEAFGMTREYALTKGVCISCHQPPTFYSDAGRREYNISALCEPCFDNMWKE